MAGLKELRTRIESIKSTQKITSAMKMVAAARLRRAQGLITKSETYNHNLWHNASIILNGLKEQELKNKTPYIYPKMMRGTGRKDVFVLMVFTSNRGLCGSYNARVAKEASRRIEELLKDGKTVKLVCIGKKGRDILKRHYNDLIVASFEDIAKKGAQYDEAANLALNLIEQFEKDEVDVCELVYAKFHSAINTEPVVQQLLPISPENNEYLQEHPAETMVNGAAYDFEPEMLTSLSDLLPLIAKDEMFKVLIESQASEHGARMSSMDNATRNAKDIISKLTLKYNRIRQTAITTELVEIIAGAEAL